MSEIDEFVDRLAEICREARQIEQPADPSLRSAIDYFGAHVPPLRQIRALTDVFGPQLPRRLRLLAAGARESADRGLELLEGRHSWPLAEVGARAAQAARPTFGAINLAERVVSGYRGT